MSETQLVDADSLPYGNQGACSERWGGFPEWRGVGTGVESLVGAKPGDPAHISFVQIKKPLYRFRDSESGRTQTEEEVVPASPKVIWGQRTSSADGGDAAVRMIWFVH